MLLYIQLQNCSMSKLKLKKAVDFMEQNSVQHFSYFIVSQSPFSFYP